MTEAPSVQAAHLSAMQAGRQNYAKRSAESQAAFFLPHLRSGMELLDLGCGPGSITIGLAERVAPGRTVGFDQVPGLPAESPTTALVTGDAYDLPFPDGSFDAIFSSALLQHLGDPLAVLVEARRVARPGAVIGLVDADWDGQLLYPNNPVLDRSIELMILLRQGTSPYVGKQLRSLLVDAGFVRCEGYARVMHYGTPDEVTGVGALTAGLFGRPATIDAATSQGWATAAELEEMAAAWREWSEMPGAFLARFWCEAIGWASV